MAVIARCRANQATRASLSSSERARFLPLETSMGEQGTISAMLLAREATTPKIGTYNRMDSMHAHKIQMSTCWIQQAD